MTMLHQGRQTSVGDSSRSKSTVRRSIDLWRRRVSSLHINVPAHAIVFYQVGVIGRVIRLHGFHVTPGNFDAFFAEIPSKEVI
ncbi:hypothetical protein Q1695_000562 [Nippostrongylus brasiliensis]|nr:hypothetical protein Q1695_000562 [Nippostrongylus brasiliensis]